MKLHLGTLHWYHQTKVRIEGQGVAEAEPVPVSRQQHAWSWSSWSSSSSSSWSGQVLAQKLDEHAELGAGEEPGVGEELGPGVGAELGVGVGLVLALALVVHLRLVGKWNHTRSHPPSSTDSRFRHHKSLCMALSHARPRRVSLWHIGWRCGP
jgi:hypothetical protein